MKPGDVYRIIKAKGAPAVYQKDSLTYNPLAGGTTASTTFDVAAVEQQLSLFHANQARPGMKQRIRLLIAPKDSANRLVPGGVIQSWRGSAWTIIDLNSLATDGKSVLFYDCVLEAA